MRIIRFFLMLTILVLAGCQNTQSNSAEELDDELSGDAYLAKEYIEEQGYEVVSFEGKRFTYTLTEELLKELPYRLYWNLPGNNPEKAMNKNVTVYTFIVRNHPLAHYNDGEQTAAEETVIAIHVAENEVVAGTSSPIFEIETDGGEIWNIHGEK
ncbi:hypothetical protein SAMN05421736_101792 [Evansella caseinilytica]|uniref:Lipoprotein n=1 Tax=Evansella caseinilytica TaxID=1503961 RepID=A0A1H3IDY6_9BACI|nr:hypothetical protein [Evansella caseinilytica]SDY25752.1 hypothetical protein SAMN05421736_101792 [Evansella caseinilytica]